MLLGKIDSDPALLIAERAAFSDDDKYLARFASTLGNVKGIGNNDIYK